MEIQQIQQIRKYVDIFLRGKVLIAGCILFALASGLALYLFEPKTYQASALLSYQQQRISPAKMSPDVQARIRDIVSTLSQIITSRTSLEQIINNIDLYTEEQKRMPMEDVIEEMRRDIKITPAGRGDTFQITYEGDDPNKVTRVANTLAAKFIEENMKYREERASETFSYTQSELEMAKDGLDQKEAVMRDYKLKYYNEMPDQRDTNMARLNSLQEQYQNRQDSIQNLERTRVLVQDQIAARKQMMEENSQLRKTLMGQRLPDRSIAETDGEKLERLKKELSLLLERYTDKHPAVRRLQQQITHLEKLVESEKKDKSVKDKNSDADANFDKGLFDMQMQLKDIRLNIERLNEEKKNLKTQIEKYEKWVEVAPVRAAEWAALTREYGELKRHYDFLVSQNLQARSALNLERKQKGSQFKIEDPARKPQTPIKPNFLKIMALALIAGTAVGSGLTLAREIIDSSFRDPSEFEDFLGVELICTVPQMSLKREKNKKLVLNVVGSAVFIFSCIALLAIFIHFYRIGRIVF